MRRSYRLISLVAAFCAGLGLFRVKYRVMALERRYEETLKSVADDREAIHILKAELTHLNDPERLQKLASHHLGFAPVTSRQIVEFGELPKGSPGSNVAARVTIDDLIDSIDEPGYAFGESASVKPAPAVAKAPSAAGKRGRARVPA